MQTSKLSDNMPFSLSLTHTCTLELSIPLIPHLAHLSHFLMHALHHTLTMRFANIDCEDLDDKHS
eukprot:EC790944.1.p5 GENE.EC790944.1~~EC790944.1.p5  ORF type:complete len:65 (-),score=8.80 EC790944.1:231-425(-)